MAVTNVSISGSVGQRIFNGLAPAKLGRTISRTLRFSAQASHTVNLTEQQSADKIEFVQTIYADNSQNNQALICLVQKTGQYLIWPAGWQGYLQVLAPEPLFLFTSAGVQDLNVQFISALIPSHIWPANGTQNFGGTTGADYSSNKPALAANQQGTTAPVNYARNSIEVQNQSAEQIQVVLDDGAGGNLSVMLLESAGSGNVAGGDWRSTTFKGRVRVFAATANDQVFIHED